MDTVLESRKVISAALCSIGIFEIKPVSGVQNFVVLLGLLIFALMTIAGKKGVLTIITVGINIVIFSVRIFKKR